MCCTEIIATSMKNCITIRRKYEHVLLINVRQQTMNQFVNSVACVVVSCEKI